MNNKKTVIGVLISIYFMFVGGCNLYSFGVSEPPYSITGKVVCDANSDDYEKGGFLCSFNNISEKTVKDVYVSFALYNGDGEPLQQIAIHIRSDIKPETKEEFCISLDEVLAYEIDDSYAVDFVYSSKIIYEDGSEWNDPMGFRYLF